MRLYAVLYTNRCSDSRHVGENASTISTHPKRPGRWAFRGKGAAYGTYTLPTIESEVFIPALVAYSWSWHHGLRIKRLELAYCQFLLLVSEIPATSEYIDFEGPPDRLQITKTGGYITEPRNSSFRPSAPPDLSPDPSLGVSPDLHARLSRDTVRFQPLGLLPWRGRTPECRGSATPKATILTRTHHSTARQTTRQPLDAARRI